MTVSNTYRISVFLLMFIISFTAIAQEDSLSVRDEGSVKPKISSIGIGVQTGFIFAHSEAVQNTKGANPIGIELIYSKQRNDSVTYAICHCYPRNGFVISYYDYDTRILDKGITAGYFLEPAYQLFRNTFFSFKGSAGVSYLTNPFDSVTNPDNQSYSTAFNAYLGVGAGLWFRITSSWSLNASVNYQHNSNGGLREPNKGINLPSAGVAIIYQQPSDYYKGERVKDETWKQKDLRWEATAFGVVRRTLTASGGSKRVPLIGISVQVAKRVGQINNLTFATEVYRDQKLKLMIKNDSLEASAIKAGLMIGHEFILGRFLFSQQLGIYVFDQTPYFDRLYHRWGLRYKFSEEWSVGINLKAHKQVANFADFRLTYFF